VKILKTVVRTILCIAALLALAIFRSAAEEIVIPLLYIAAVQLLPLALCAIGLFWLWSEADNYWSK
jgi:hypothetical protein